MVYFLAALFGLVFGSFLNVCIVRLPGGQSVVLPPSHCPVCKHPIRWFDNIPVLSYLLLGGRCRDCHTRISPMYAIVEASTALLFVTALYRFGLTLEYTKAIVLIMMLTVLIFTDLRERRIPHPVTVLGICAGLILSFFVQVDNQPMEWVLGRMGFTLGKEISSILGSLAGAVVGGGLFYAVGEAFYILGGRQKEYLGFGDVMLMLMVGTFLGIPLTLLTVLLGSLAGTVVALSFTLVARRFRDYPWPYGTFLGIAAIYSVLDGTRLLHAYLRWSGLGG